MTHDEGRERTLALITVQRFFTDGAVDRSAFLDSLAVLIDHGAPEVLPDLVTFSCNDTEDSFAVCGAITTLVRKLEPARMVSLDGQLRHLWIDRRSSGALWGHASVALLEESAAKPERQCTIALLSCNSDGYVREAALRHLIDNFEPYMFPFLLIRLNDWVLPVKFLAEAGVTRHLNASLLPILIECLPLLAHLRSSRRADASAVLADVHGVVMSSDGRRHVEQGLASPHRSVRRLCASMLLRSPDAAILQRLLADDDVVVHKASAEWVLAQGREVASKHIGALLGDRAASIRRATLEWLIAHDVSAASAVLGDFLFDRDARLRERAQWLFEKEDPATIYRRHLVDRPLIALRGLGECGSAADALLVLPFLASNMEPVRAAAVAALGALDGDTHRGALLERVGGSRLVGDCAARAVRRLTRKIPAQDLWRELERATDEQGKIRLLDLISETDKWTSIQFLLRGVGDEVLRVPARSLIGQWVAKLSRNFVEPSRADRVAARNALTMNARHLDPSWVSAIRDALN